MAAGEPRGEPLYTAVTAVLVRFSLWSYSRALGSPYLELKAGR